MEFDNWALSGREKRQTGETWVLKPSLLGMAMESGIEVWRMCGNCVQARGDDLLLPNTRF